MSEILNLIVDIGKTLLVLGLLWLIPHVKQYLTIRSHSDDDLNIHNLVNTLVEAAEQMLKADDPTGEKRKEYVMEQLVKLEVEITEEIDAYIESSVYKLNQEKKH